MTRTTINWGVLGASAFALSTMAPAIHAARRSRFAALATRDTSRAAPFTAFAPDLRVHDSYDALLADPEIDAVYIPLPNGLHVEWTERAVRAGKAVLCEKPIGLTVGDLDRLIALRDETGIFVAEAWMPAHHPQWSRAREIISGGAIGRLHTVTGYFTFGLHDPSNVRNSAVLGGGALRDIGIYPTSAFRFATGLEPRVTMAEAVWEDGIDASTWVATRAGDVRFSFHVSMRTTRRQGMTFEGSEGALLLPAPFNPGPAGEAQLHLERPGNETLVQRFPDIRQYELQVEAVAATLLDGADFAMPLEMSRGTQAVLDAVFDRLGTPG